VIWSPDDPNFRIPVLNGTLLQRCFRYRQVSFCHYTLEVHPYVKRPTLLAATTAFRKLETIKNVFPLHGTQICTEVNKMFSMDLFTIWKIQYSLVHWPQNLKMKTKSTNTQLNLQHKLLIIDMNVGKRKVQWLRCCATNQKVAGSIPDGVIGIFHWHNPSDSTMATSISQGVKSCRCVSVTTLPTSWAIVT